MTITSGMYVVTTTPEDGAVYWAARFLSGFIVINVIILLVLIVVRKWVSGFHLVVKQKDIPNTSV